MQYWIIKDGESKGPFTLEELKALNINETTKIWYKGLNNWTIAKDTDLATELFAAETPVLEETPAEEPIPEPAIEEPVEVEEPAEEEKVIEEEPEVSQESHTVDSQPDAPQPPPTPPTPPTPPAPPTPPTAEAATGQQNTFNHQALNEAYQSGYRQGLKDGISMDSDTDPNRCPPTNLVWAILSTVLCCVPFGIVAIVYASKVSSKYAQGDLQGAWKASRYAAYWALASFISSIILFPIQFAMGFL